MGGIQHGNSLFGGIQFDREDPWNTLRKSGQEATFARGYFKQWLSYRKYVRKHEVYARLWVDAESCVQQVALYQSLMVFLDLAFSELRVIQVKGPSYSHCMTGQMLTAFPRRSK